MRSHAWPALSAPFAERLLKHAHSSAAGLHPHDEPHQGDRDREHDRGAHDSVGDRVELLQAVLDRLGGQARDRVEGLFELPRLVAGNDRGVLLGRDGRGGGEASLIVPPASMIAAARSRSSRMAAFPTASTASLIIASTRMPPVE